MKYPKIAKKLGQMAARDQEMRRRFLDNPEDWDESVDFDNTKLLRDIVAEIGWPTMSKVGKEGSRNAWLIVQHADHDPEFQSQCLRLMRYESDIELKNVGYLEDRIRINSSHPQLYGTQGFLKDGVWAPHPIEDIENVDSRRAAIGLESLSRYVRLMNSTYGKG